MRSRALFLSAAATLSFACAAAVLPLSPLGQAWAQGNPTATNVIPEGGHYSAQGKVQSLDPGALRLVLVTEKAGPVPMTIAPEADLSNVSAGDVADIHYTRSVTFVVGSPNVPVNDVSASHTVGQVMQTPGGIGPDPATIVGRVVRANGSDSFDVVNANGGGVYTIKVTNPARQEAVRLLKVGDSVTVFVSPLIATSIAKCGVFGMGLLGC